ncbi:MAG: tRNA (guanine(10)-N(2))-dimethyltransferase [Candidatus Thorarchaeota archaeon]|nr:tRNA (guanine(10)-N(2))-dimethyltransferase [Candidatus Thorarchaeota archaeon]
MTIEREYTEGRITFLSADVEHYSGNKKQITASIPVFYNEKMRLNRDISVLFLSAYLRENKIETMCEPLTGSGVRTLRYLKECPGDFTAKLFDVNPNAIEIARKNIKSLNLETRAQVLKGDAKLLLLTESREKRFDYVDVDPFGTPAPYVNAAIQSLNPDGGLLALTATDMPVLCGAYQKVALRRYGGFSVRAPFVHEVAVRLLEGFAFRVAGLNDCSITPLAVLSTDHYIRTWIKIEADRKKSNRQTENLGIIKFCEGCMQTQIIPQPQKYDNDTFEHAMHNCKGLIRMAGPLWIGDLFKIKQLKGAQEIFNQDDASYYHKRVQRILEEMIEEHSLIEIPFIDLHALCDLHNFTPPKNSDIIQYLKTMGYSATRTHFRPTAIRTNAPVAEVVSAIKNLMKR